MTAICPAGGPSSPKLGAAEWVTYTSGLLGAIFAAYDMVWLIPLVPFLGLAPLELNAFCATDPPTEPAFTSDETSALLNLRFGSDFDSGLAKLVDLAKGMIWRELCECDSGTATPFAPPAIPPGTPITQYYAPTNDPCDAVFTYTDAFAAGGGSLNRGGPILTAGVHPSAFVYHCVGTPGFSGTAGSFNWTFEQVGPGNVTLRSDVVNVPTPTATVDRTVQAVANVQQIRLTQASVSGTTTQKITGTTITSYCGVPNAPQAPCCPPDIAVQSTLDAIFSLVQLIQRQSVPFATIDGASHPGVTGNGEISVHGLIGLRIDITTLPGRTGVTEGHPDTYFGIGWIRMGDSTSWSPRWWIDADPWILLPPSAGIYTRLGYSIASDVTVTITEIVREP